MPDPQHITQLLKLAGDGDSQAAADLLPLVYEELREVAASRMRKVAPGQTLQPTALVHEAYLRVVGDDDSDYENRGHFFFVAARAMQDILVEQARHKATLKKGGDRQRVSGDNLAMAIEAPAEDMLELSAALEVLEREYPRQHRLVMLRFFAGLSIPQAAEVLGVNERTAARDWRFAKAQLFATLTDLADPDDIVESAGAGGKDG